MQGSFLKAIAFAGAALVGSVPAFSPLPSHAEVSFAGKTVTLIVPFGEGGGTDIFARFMQPFLQKHLPGKPSVVVLNKPGGASVTASNWFERNAEPDGQTVFLSGSSTVTNYVFGGKKVKFDMLGWRPVALSPAGTCFYVKKAAGITGKDPVEDVKKLRAGKWVVATQNPVSSSVRYFMALEMLGVNNMTYLYGLGSGARRKAFLRDEVNISIDTSPSCLKKVSNYVKKGTTVIFMSFGHRMPDGSIGRDPAFPDLYTVREAYKAVNGKEPSGQIWTMLKHFVNFAGMVNRGMFLPKGTNDEIYNTYISALEKTFKDPEFQKKQEQVLGGYPQVLGPEAATVLKEAVDLSPATRDWLRAWVKKISM